MRIIYCCYCFKSLYVIWSVLFHKLICYLYGCKKYIKLIIDVFKKRVKVNRYFGKVDGCWTPNHNICFIVQSFVSFLIWQRLPTWEKQNFHVGINDIHYRWTNNACMTKRFSDLRIVTGIAGTPEDSFGDMWGTIFHAWLKNWPRYFILYRKRVLCKSHEWITRGYCRLCFNYTKTHIIIIRSSIYWGQSVYKGCCTCDWGTTLNLKTPKPCLRNQKAQLSCLWVLILFKFRNMSGVQIVVDQFSLQDENTKYNIQYGIIIVQDSRLEGGSASQPKVTDLFIK